MAIEFIAQAFRVIRGGRDPLRSSHSTLEPLGYRAVEGALTANVAGRLKRSYVMLHQSGSTPFQYVDDQQTQLWPTDPAAASLRCHAVWERRSFRTRRYRKCNLSDDI